MRSRYKVLLRYLCCLSTLSWTAVAQQRDAGALAILAQATSAMGGSSFLAQVNSAQVTGSLQAVPNTDAQSGTFTWEMQFSSSSYQFRDEFKTDARDRILVSGSGNPALSNNGTIRQLPPYIYLAMPPLQLPVVALSVFLTNTTYTVTLQSPVTLNGVPANHVHVSVDTDDTSRVVTPQEWYFDPASGLPVRVEFRMPSTLDPTQYMQSSADFSNYQPVGAILTPLTISNTEDGVQDSSTTITSVVWNCATSPSDFTF